MYEIYKKIMKSTNLFVTVILFLSPSTFSFGQQDGILEECSSSQQDCHKISISHQRHSAKLEKNSLPEPFKIYQTKNKTSVQVFDNVFRLKELLILDKYSEMAGKWQYRSSNEYGLPPWTAPLNSFQFATTTFGKKLEELAIAVSGKPDIKLSNVQLNIVRRQDPVKVSFFSDIYGDEYTAVLYMNQIWRKNDYGDAIFYERGADLALGTVKPLFGRVIIFDSNIGFLCRPPSVQFRPGQVFLLARFTSNQTRVEEMQQKYENHQKKKEQTTAGLFQNMLSKSYSKEDIKKTLVKHHMSTSGKQIFVFDDLFMDEDLDRIEHHVLNYGNFFYDDSFDLDSDNVIWIAGFSVDDFVASRLWPIVKQVAAFSSGKDSWFPYDISCNIIRNADYTRIHEDCEEHEEEWTFLLYLNRDWSPDYYGETAFFETTEDDSEVIASVLPKYGRVVIFEGFIPHSARPPSTIFNSTRLSFAVKLSVTEKIARKKMFLTSLWQEKGMHNMMESILKEHNKPHFEFSYKKSVLTQINEQRNVDWETAKYTFQGESTEMLMQKNIYEDNDIDEDNDNDDEGSLHNDEEKDSAVATERHEYVENLLKHSADDLQKLKEHFKNFENQQKIYTKHYAKDMLSILQQN